MNSITINLIGFGDSNTAGSNFPEHGYDITQTWVNQTGAVNAGVGGNDILEGYARYRADVLLKRPKFVTIMFGTNDMILNSSGVPKVAKDVFEDHLNKMVTWAHDFGIVPILMTTQPIQQTSFYTRNSRDLYTAKGGVRNWANSYNEITRRVASEKGVILIDNYANFTLKAGGVGDAYLTTSGLIAPDGTHMTPRGHGVIAYSVNHYTK